MSIEKIGEEEEREELYDVYDDEEVLTMESARNRVFEELGVGGGNRGTWGSFGHPLFTGS